MSVGGATENIHKMRFFERVTFAFKMNESSVSLLFNVFSKDHISYILYLIYIDMLFVNDLSLKVTHV